VDQKSAQNEFYLAQSIAQDIVRQDYGLVITLSTPILQIMARANDAIPHIAGESPQDIQIEDFRPEKIWVNADIAEEYGIRFPQDFLNRAERVIRTP